MLCPLCWPQHHVVCRHRRRRQQRYAFLRAFPVRGIPPAQSRERAAQKEKLRRKLQEELPQTDQKLQRLIDANRALLDKYQEPVRRQAHTSYAYAQAAITVGLLVLLVGAGITIAASETATQVGIAALTGVGTVLSGYVGRTYLRVYEHAQQQLNFYFREPLVTSYLLTAERLTQELQGERRDSAYSDMVSQIVGGVGGELGPLVGDDSKVRRSRHGNACSGASPQTQLRTKSAAEPGRARSA